MSTKIEIVVSKNDVDITFSGDHLRKILLNRVMRALKLAHRDTIREYRKCIVSKRKQANLVEKEKEKENGTGKQRTGTEESGNRPDGTSAEDRQTEQTDRGSEVVGRLEEIRRRKTEEGRARAEVKTGS